LENRHNHQPTSPLPIWEGRGDRSHPSESGLPTYSPAIPARGFSQRGACRGGASIAKNKAFERKIIYML
jgi:hypothetical protein